VVLVQKFFTVVLIVVVLGVLLRINATLLGWAFVLVDVPTVLYSNHTIGAGIGFGFMQSNPPGPVPVAVGNAYNLYSAWSYGRTDEPYLSSAKTFWIGPIYRRSGSFQSGQSRHAVKSTAPVFLSKSQQI
jgi:hypothetical protein